MKISAAMIFLLMLVASDDPVPEQNRTKGDPPDVSGAKEGASKLLDALKRDDPSVAAGFFFPADAFDLVKDMAVPGRYHKKLVRWYEEDIHKEHGRFKSVEWQFEDIELGRCRWKEPGAEGNKLPYWSCGRNTVTARAGDRIRRFEIRVLINWGENWYVTHLGPIRK